MVVGLAEILALKSPGAISARLVQSKVGLEVGCAADVSAGWADNTAMLQKAKKNRQQNATCFFTQHTEWAK